MKERRGGKKMQEVQESEKGKGKERKGLEGFPKWKGRGSEVTHVRYILLSSLPEERIDKWHLIVDGCLNG